MDLSSLPPLHGQLSLATASAEYSGSFSISGFLTDRDFLEDTQGRGFNENDGEEAVKCLRRGFQVTCFTVSSLPFIVKDVFLKEGNIFTSFLCQKW